MTIPKTAGDLFLKKMQNDKHFLLWKNIEIFWKNKIEFNFNENDKIISFEEIDDFKKKTKISIEYEEWKIKSISWEWLLSMWSTLLFKNWNDFDIALIQRDKDAKHDALHFTMPAWRLDDTLTNWCLVELFEEIIFANWENYFQLDKWVCDFSQIQKYRIEKLWLPKKSVDILKSKEIKIPWMFTVSMFLWDREIDYCKNLFFYIDEKNKTLEFRKVFISEKKDFEFIYDWDWYKRNMFLVSLNELKKWKLKWKVSKFPEYNLKNIEKNEEKLLLTETLKGFLGEV